MVSSKKIFSVSVSNYFQIRKICSNSFVNCYRNSQFFLQHFCWLLTIVDCGDKQEMADIVVSAWQGDSVQSVLTALSGHVSATTDYSRAAASSSARNLSWGQSWPRHQGQTPLTWCLSHWPQLRPTPITRLEVRKNNSNQFKLNL